MEKRRCSTRSFCQAGLWIAFCNDSSILLRIEDNKYKLTGGKPEKTDKNYEETLKREYLEELNVEL